MGNYRYYRYLLKVVIFRFYIFFRPKNVPGLNRKKIEKTTKIKDTKFDYFLDKNKTDDCVTVKY